MTTAGISRCLGVGQKCLFVKKREKVSWRPNAKVFIIWLKFIHSDRNGSDDSSPTSKIGILSNSNIR